MIRTSLVALAITATVLMGVAHGCDNRNNRTPAPTIITENPLQTGRQQP